MSNNEANETAGVTERASTYLDFDVVDNRAKRAAALGHAAREAVALTGAAIGSQPSMLSNLVYANAASTTDLSAKSQLANQQAQNELMYSILAKAVNTVQNEQLLQARCAVEVLSGNELVETISELMAAGATPTSD